MSSNQGRDLGKLLQDVEVADVKAAAAALWREVGNHPGHASCECPALEVLAVLYERGYQLVHPSQPSVWSERQR